MDLASAPLDTPLTLIRVDASTSRQRLATLGLREGASFRLLIRTIRGGRIVLVGGSGSRSAKACCHTSPQHTAGTDAPVVALVGAPNTGKSTLFNALTGSCVTTGNWPGTTVAVSRGVWRTTLATPTCDCENCTCAHDEDPLSASSPPGSSWPSPCRTSPRNAR
jgi:hypothetical protein